MAVTPSTNLKLLKCPIELDNKNQLTFANATAQFNYFNELPHTELIDDSYYQRKDSFIEFPAHIDSIIEYNYCMYQNENYTDKWFYAYITKMEYLSDGCTRVFIATDVFQTWQFDITWKKSFIVREMLSTAQDLPGANLLPEGLETGEYKIQSSTGLQELLPVYVIAYARNPYTDGLTSQVPPAQGVIANGIPNGMFFCIASEDYLQGALDTINRAGFGESIVTVFSVPAFSLIGFNDWTLSDILEGVEMWFVSDFKANKVTKTLSARPTALDGYTPKNKKLLTYPYLYMGFNPPNGSSKIYRFEDFSGTPSFDMYSEINQNPNVLFVPQYYRGGSINTINDCCNLSGYPVIGWITEYYNAWLAQNSGIIDINMRQEDYNYRHGQGIAEAQNQIGTGNALMGALGSLVSGNIVGGIQGAIGAGADYAISNEKMQMATQNHYEYINMQMAIKEQQQLLPNQGHLTGSNATLLGYELFDNDIFTVYSIKSQFAKRIDDYFSMYGYATNELKIPNTNNRSNWNYVRTEGANIIGNIPQEDLQTIKNIFDTGVTLWHNSSTFLDYSQSNT